MKKTIGMILIAVFIALFSTSAYFRSLQIGRTAKGAL